MQKFDEKVDEIRDLIDSIGLEVETGYTLADAMREGSKVSEQAFGWGNGETMCALSAASAAARARGHI